MTPTSTFSAFAPAVEESRELPKLNCLGHLGAIGDAHITASGVYARIPFVIEPTQGGKKGFGGILFRPEWLRPGFNPASLNAEDNGKTLHIVYKINIACNNQVSVLQGLSGSEENFNTLAAQIQSAIQDLPSDTPEETAVFISTVRDVIAEFASEVSPEVGYFSGQKMEDSGEKKPSGAKLKRPVAGQREIVGYFLPSADSHKRNEADAAKGKSVMAYSSDN